MNNNISRAEYAKMVNRLIGRDDRYFVDAEQSLYSDLKLTHWAYKEIQRASFGFSSKVGSNGYFSIDPSKKYAREKIDLN